MDPFYLARLFIKQCDEILGTLPSKKEKRELLLTLISLYYLSSFSIRDRLTSTETEEELLEENALSEGEYMLLVRLGLLAIGRSTECQCLYLFDEPDVYLNERWNIDFVSMIHKIYEGTTPLHEIIVATHSSLILTDAFPEQLYYFQSTDGQAECFNIHASTFGGSRNEIMQALFQTHHSVGSFAYNKVISLLETSDNADELESALESIGSGYLRLRLLDKIQHLRDQGK